MVGTSPRLQLELGRANLVRGSPAPGQQSPRGGVAGIVVLPVASEVLREVRGACPGPGSDGPIYGADGKPLTGATLARDSCGARGRGVEAALSFGELKRSRELNREER